jgi:CRP/FNR family transcriptional regulator, anaerobic regulatory protein
MEQLLTFLHAVNPLSPTLRARLQDMVQFKTLSKGALLLKAGQVNREICFIQTGLLRCFYLRKEKDVTSWFMKEGDVIVSVESFHDQVPSYESIEALEPCEMFYISFQELESLYKEFPEFNFNGRKLTEKYHKLWNRYNYILKMHTARERYQIMLDSNPEIIRRAAGIHVASYLGINRVTYSKIKSPYPKHKKSK